MKLEPARWRVLSELLDHALDLEAPARDAWLATLSGEAATLRPLLADLLARRARAQTGDFIDALPGLDEIPPLDGDLHAPGALVGPYRLVRVIGRGGMGEVWLAERADGLVRRPVALKLPLLALSRGALAERLARERDALAALAHANIARLYDAGFADGQPYLALEYVDGVPITRYADAHALDLCARLALFGQVLGAIAHAHANLILHRDIKPSNILVTPAGEVKLLDFGIAKLLTDGEARETELTRMGGSALTLDYASPEQIAGAPLTTAADVYALGVVLYELLTGARPYKLKRGSRAELEEAILARDGVPPRHAPLTVAVARARGTTLPRLRAALGGDLGTIIGKALKKDPAERYATVDALAADLRRYAAREPVSARPESRGYRLRKFLGRNRLPVAVGTGVIAILVAATGVSLWQAQRAQEEAARAQRQAQRAESVRDFLAQLFRASGVNQRAAQEVRSMTAVQLLERGTANVESLRASAPDAYAYLLRLFGEMHEELQLPAESVALHRRSVAAAREAYGVDARETALAELELAWMLKDTLHADEGWPLVEHAKSVLERVAPRSGDYAQTLYFEAAFLRYGDPARAMASGAASVQLMESLHLDDFRAAFAHWMYAEALAAGRRHEDALARFRVAAAAFERLYGPDNKNVGSIHASLATVLREMGRIDEARAALERAVAIYERYPEQRVFGVASNRVTLSRLLQASGDPAGAREQLDLALRARSLSDAEGLPTSGQIRGLKAMLLLSQGDLAEGVAQLSAVQQETPASLHLAHLAYCDALAEAYLALGKPDAARAQVERGRRILEERGATAYRVFAIAAAAAHTAAARGDKAAAEAELVTARGALPPTGADPSVDVVLAEARVYDALHEGERVRAVTEPVVPLLLRADAPMDLRARGELALRAGRSRRDTDADTAGALLDVAGDALRRTQVAGSPLLAAAAAARARLVAPVTPPAPRAARGSPAAARG